jgi:DNA-binding response OmpR family regulator
MASAVKPRLLVVEDDPVTAGALRALFSRRGWDVLSAGTLAEAEPLLQTNPAWMILDLMLPDGDGATLLRAIRAGGLEIRVAVTTGASDPDRLRAVADLHPTALFRKPVNLGELLGTVV